MAPRRTGLFGPPKSVLRTLLEDVRGTPAEKLALFEKLKAAGRLHGEEEKDLKLVENMLRGLGEE